MSSSSFLGRLPSVTRNLIIINFVCWLADILVSRTLGIDFTSLFGLHYFASQGFMLWQPFTYMFMHANFGHIFFNMFAVLMFAPPLEERWGSKRFLIYYLVCGVGAGLVQELVWWLFASQYAMYAVTIGASGAVFGILFAFGWLFPDVKMFLLFVPIPIPARVFVTLYAFFELWQGIAPSAGDNVAHFAHLGGMLFGWLLLLWWRRKDRSTFSATPYESKVVHWIRSKIKSGRRRKAERMSQDYSNYHYQDPIADDKTDEQREKDRILENIKHNGYESLTEDEKRKIFR